ncbi:MAG: hypothetical protein H7Z75_01970 [Ferruginibacter sp.]|nr:hypothetical protein [Cytophagales bacterium]
MNVFLNNPTLLLGSLLLSACGVLKESPKYQLTDGIYYTKTASGQSDKVYVQVREDTILVYPFTPVPPRQRTVVNQPVLVIPPESKENGISNQYGFTVYSFDFDILTIPFKIRPSTSDFPPQFNTNFNGNVYLGYRWDKYAVRYEKTPIGSLKRSVAHYGYSVGGFTGIGATAVNPWVTNNQVASEYDGIVNLTGVAAILAINNVTLGVGVGIDHLLEGNRRYWIYQRKPWVGLTFGVNLN